MDLETTALRLITCPRCDAGPRARCMTRTGRTATYSHAARTAPLYDAWHDGYGEAERSAANYARSLAERGKSGAEVAALLERVAR